MAMQNLMTPSPYRGTPCIDYGSSTTWSIVTLEAAFSKQQHMLIKSYYGTVEWLFLKCPPPVQLLHIHQGLEVKGTPRCWSGNPIQPMRQ